MYNLFAELALTADTAPPGLVQVASPPSSDLALDEQVAARQALQFSPPPDFIFFRRFADGRSSQVAAYVIDNSDERYDKEALRKLHHKLWLSGAAPLLYVGQRDRVDILTCAAGKSVSRDGEWKYSPSVSIKDTAAISELLPQFSAHRLADGTFWEDQDNSGLFNRNAGAHKVLIDKVKQADIALDGTHNSTARRLLLLTLLIKYLEDRNVFPPNWFSTFYNGANSFYDVLVSGRIDSVRRMLSALERKFNGDIFVLSDASNAIDSNTLRALAGVIHPRVDNSGQLYFWDIYSFEYIPVEVLSHIYQHFVQEGKGAVFTPPLLVNLLLDQVMPLNRLQGNETIFDPSCGSGIFLVAAFKRLIYVWLSKNNWRKPTPQELKQLLSKTIYGVELQEEAAQVAAFSLALAICDALLPEIIWQDLKFDKHIGHNLLVGDFGEVGDQAKAVATGENGFDIIVGNPPFKKKPTKAIQKYFSKNKGTIPDKQIAYYFLFKCSTEYLKQGGRIGMVQPSGLLYNSKTFDLFAQYSEKVQIDSVFDFVSIRRLFSGADTKIVAVIATNKEANSRHEIQHWTFRRTFSAESQILFELDHYDHHLVLQKYMKDKPWMWRVNLLGGGRLFHFAQRVKEMPTLKKFVTDRGWAYGEGIMRGNAANQSPWIYKGMDSVVTAKFKTDVLEADGITALEEDEFESTRRESLFKSPIVLIKSNDSLPCAYWDKGDLAYYKSIVGISTSQQYAQELKAFRKQFIKVRDSLRAALLFLGTRGLTVKSTSILKYDIDNLPWPEDGDWGLAPWEKELADDTTEYMAEFVRLGQNSKLLQERPNNVQIDAYCDTFKRLMEASFPEVVPCGSGESNGLRFQAFSFGRKSSVDWLDRDDWLSHLQSTVFLQHGHSLRTVRLIRLYEGNALILIKPDLLRYWIRSTAIRDVDGTVTDIMSNE